MMIVTILFMRSNAIIDIELPTSRRYAMGLSRRVGFFSGLKYHGGSPMWAWMIHRVTGLAMLTFVGLHVIASFFMQQTGSDLATSINTVYESWIFQIVVTRCLLHKE